MDRWRLATRFFVGAWIVLGLILVFKVWAWLTGTYLPDWQTELRFWAPLVVMSSGFLAARVKHAPQKNR